MESQSWETGKYDSADRPSKVQVTFLASEWGSSKGGLSTINRELAIQLAKFPEVDITFFLPRCSQEDKNLARQHNVNIVEATRRPGYEELEWLSFPPDHLQIDIIVGHGVKLGRQAHFIQEWKKCKWVQVVHTDPEELGMFKSYSIPIAKGEEKHKTEVELCEMADLVVGVGPKLSEAFRSYLRGFQKDKSVVDFTPGIFEEFVSVAQVAEERKQRSVLVFGRGDAEDFELKGFDIAGKAVAALQDTRLVFVGAPSGKHEEIAKLLTGCGVPTSRLRVRGFVEDRDNLKRLFQEVDLVVMPSRTEGFGLAGLEALSAGVPVLVSHNSGFGEALCSVPFGSTFVVNSEDPTDWTTAIKKIFAKDRKSRLEEVETLRDSYDRKYIWAEQMKSFLHKMMISWTRGECSVESRKRNNEGDITENIQTGVATARKTMSGMIASRSIDPDSAASGCLSYSRLCRLLISLGSKALRQRFDRIIPPQNLQRILKRNPAHSKLQSRRKEGVLNAIQWSKLYPTTTSEVSSEGFDISLLIVLLRTICRLSPPSAGWDAPPLSEDASCESDIARVKYFMTAVSTHAGVGCISDAVFTNYWQQIRDTLVRLGGADYEDDIDEMKDQEMDLLTEEHFRELLKQWRKVEDSIKDKLNELESVEASVVSDASFPTDTVDKIRQLYGTRERRLLPVPWCDDFSFHLNEIFTKLTIVSREKTRGVLTDDITNMTAIFKAHAECERPRTILIEGDPGMGKSTYCQKLAYDWATKQEQWDPSFPEIEVLLLLKCHEMKSNIWEAIDEQILPAEFDDAVKEGFFRYVRENQSKVLLVIDGLDEVGSSELDKVFDLVKGKELSGCHIVITSRHEVGKKLRRYCDTLWEIVGFAKKDAASFIRTYFKNIKKEHLAENLIGKISGWDELEALSELTKNPLHTTLLCILCEDFEGVFPTSRTPLYTEIVLCVLRRYEEKQGLSSKSEDLISIYKERLIDLGRVALDSLRKGELYFEEHASGGSFIVLSKFGFLSLQISGSKRKISVRYAFLHKSFQEFFAGFFLAWQILNGNIDYDSVVADQRFKAELKQVFLFMTGILASTSMRSAESLVKSMAVNINLIACRDVSKYFLFALDCILECPSLAHILGIHLNLTNLDLNNNDISASGLASLSQALAANSSLTKLCLRWNNIGAAGAASLSQALAANSSLTKLDLVGNKIGASGAASLSQALAANSSLTKLVLRWNNIGAAGAASLSQALAANSSLTKLGLRSNNIGASGAASLSQALAANSSLTNLDLCENNIGAAGAASLSQAFAANSSLTNLDLSRNNIGASGAASLSQALAANSSLTNLDLCMNNIGDAGAASLSQALAANSSLTNLDLIANRIGAYGAASLFQALAANSSLTNLELCFNNIGASGAASLSQALAANSSLTKLDLCFNNIGDAGAASLSQALAANSSLTNLYLFGNLISAAGVASLSQAGAANSSLTNLQLHVLNMSASCAVVFYGVISKVDF